MSDFSSSLTTRIILLLALLLSGCSAMNYTVDDGSPVDEKLLANIQLFGRAEQTLRPAVMRSSALRDKDCDKQWELPFAVASSASWKEGPERIAWARALHVDERVTVIATTPDAALALGDKIIGIGDIRSKDTEHMIRVLARRRDGGKPFTVTSSSGKSARIVPVEVCRGHVLPAPPSVPGAQDYHWLMTVHPLEVFRKPLTPDEALWVVLWTQGISEAAGARMKAYHYGKNTLTTLLTLASVASAVASNAAGQFVAGQVVQEVGKDVAEQLVDAANQSAMDLEKKAEAIAAANRSALTGISWVAGGSFEKADQWSFERMGRLGADPLAAFTLHEKLVRQVAARNAFVFDKERLPPMKALVAALGKEAQLTKLLNDGPLTGTPSAISGVSLEAMPLSSEETAQNPISMESFPLESRGGFLDSLPLPRATE